MEFHPHEIAILKNLKTKSSPKEIAEKTNLGIDAVLRAYSWLATKGLVGIEEKIEKEISLGEAGLRSSVGLPERVILNVIGREGKNELEISEIQKLSGLSKEDFSIGLGWLRKKNLAKLEEGRIKILSTEKTDDEKFLEILRTGKVLNSEKLTPEQKKGYELLKTRQDIIKVSERKEITLIPIEEGIRIGESTRVEETISQLTPELLTSGEWKDKKFREYDVNVYVTPEKPAKRHPLQKLIEEIREIFVELGFEEISGNFVESAFWNFDALFVAQDHPAREMHDTFYLKEPKNIEIPKFKELKNRIKETHESGWTTGSTGWGGKWDENIAKKTLLRTHTTAVTARYLSGLKKEDLPKKVFSIGKVFRNEAVDYKHLPEFYQVEGIIVDENVDFRHLLGILKEFYDRMGFEVRFRPGYFPYTEMSIEPEIYLKERDEWIELGGAGIFRPEVVKPLLGFDCPVLAWGLGLDRVAALRLGLSDIRGLYW